MRSQTCKNLHAPLLYTPICRFRVSLGAVCTMLLARAQTLSNRRVARRRALFGGAPTRRHERTRWPMDDAHNSFWHHNEPGREALCSRRHFVGLAGAMALAPFLAREAWAAEAPADDRTLTDMDGDQVKLPASVTRYADAWGDHVAFDCLLDGGAGLVAVATSKKDRPWLYAMAPSLSQVPTVAPNKPTDLATFDPQLVFASDDDLRDDLSVPVLDVDFDTLAGLKQSLGLTAKALGGDAPSKADAYLKEFDQTLAEVEKATADIETGERPTVLFGDAVYEGRIEGTDSLANEWIMAAGGINANPSDGDTDNATVADVLLWNPDIIVTGSLDDAQRILNDRSWDGIAAVREGRVYACPRGLNSWAAAGPELVLQVLWLAGTMYPDLFPTDEVATRIQGFYRTYYGFEASFEDVELMLAAQGPEAAPSA